MTREIEPKPSVIEPSIARAFAFEHKYLQEHPQAKDDKKLQGFFTDLTDGRFWTVMARIDGETDRVYKQVIGIPSRIITDEDTARWRKEERDWADKNFTPTEIDEIINIYLDQALHAPVGRIGPAAPGSLRGHSLAFEQLVENTHSRFADRVTPDLKRQLANGRLWEELPDAVVGINSMYSLSALQGLFTDYFDLLDPNFAPEGFTILDRNEKGFARSQPDLEYLTDEAIDNYLEFVRKIHEQKDDLGLSKDHISRLMKPYISTLLSPDTWDHDYSYRFGPHYDPELDDEVIPQKQIIERFEDPLVQEFLLEPSIRKMLMGEIEGVLEYKTDLDSDVIPQVVARIPNHHEFLADMAFSKLKGIEWIKKLRSDVNQIASSEVSS